MANLDQTISVRGSIVTPKTSSRITASNEGVRKGIAFPFKNDKSYLNYTVDLSLAKANLAQLLRTSPGERVMLPTFGCDLDSLLFEPFDENLVLEARRRIVYSISNFIPYLEIVKLKVLRIDESSRFGLNTLLINLTCRIKNEENSNFNLELKV